jgi:hypothetical protein
MCAVQRFLLLVCYATVIAKRVASFPSLFTLAKIKVASINNSRIEINHSINYDVNNCGNSIQNQPFNNNKNHENLSIRLYL